MNLPAPRQGAVVRRSRRALSSWPPRRSRCVPARRVNSPTVIHSFEQTILERRAHAAEVSENRVVSSCMWLRTCRAMVEAATRRYREGWLDPVQSAKLESRTR
jgi:hypothetical protein